MPPRDPSLPEGTDHIIDTNIDLGDSGSSGGGSGGTGASGGGSGGDTGRSGGGAGGTSASGGNTGASSGSTTGSSGGGSSSSPAFKFDQKDGGGSDSGGFAGQVKEQISKLTDQAGERARGFADDGKRQATDFLKTIADIVGDAASSVEEKLGGQYAGVGHRASDSIQSLAGRLDQRSVDDLMQDARSFVQKSPAIAVGIAAVVGFAVARVLRSSISEWSNSAEDTGGSGSSGGGNSGGNAATGSSGTTGAGA